MDIISHFRCTGCMACVDACPVGALSFSVGEDTFLRPLIDDARCINCGLCRKKCVAINPPRKFKPIACYAAVARDNRLLINSSSGGAFSVIVNALAQVNRSQCDDIYVVGAAFDDEFQVVHKVVKYTGPQSLDPLRKSKYIQSNTVGVYKEIKNLLTSKRKLVIFSGTPCQVAALRSVLGMKNDNLFCVDLVCRGAPSQYMFNKYRSELESSNESKIEDYSFKCKETLDNGTQYSRSCRIQFLNGKVLKLSRLEDEYLKLFYSKIPRFQRACDTCIFKDINRVGDITLGDAWGIEKYYANLNPLHGVSLILNQSEKAAALKPYIKEEMELYDISLEQIASQNSFSPEEVDRSTETYLYKDMFNDDIAFSRCISLARERIQ